MNRPNVELIKEVTVMQANITSRAPRDPRPGFAMWPRPIEVIALCNYILELEKKR